MAHRNWSFTGKLVGLALAAGLAVYGCSGGGDDFTVGSGLAIRMDLANPQAPVAARVVTPEVAAFKVSLYSHHGDSWTTVTEKVFPRDRNQDRQTLALTRLDPGNYTLRVWYLGTQGQTLHMYQEDIVLSGGSVAQIVSPEYLPATDFTAELTTTASSPFPIRFTPEGSGYPSGVVVDGSGPFTGTLADGVYGIESPVTVQMSVTAPPGTTVMPQSFTAGPAFSQTLVVHGLPMSDLGVEPRAGYEVTRTAASPAPWPLGTYVFYNNTSDSVRVSPHSTNPSFQVAVPGGTPDSEGMYTVPRSQVLKLQPSFSDSQVMTGTVTGDLECYVSGQSLTGTVSAPMRVNVVPSQNPQ